MFKASDIMRTDVVTVKPDTTIEELGKVFINTALTSLPVADDKGRLVGMVSEHDLITRSKRLHIPTVLQLFDAVIPIGTHAMEDELKKMTAATVDEICTHDVISVTEATPMDEIATIMSERKVHTLPVLRDGKIVGVLNQHDFIKGVANEAGKPGA